MKNIYSIYDGQAKYWLPIFSCENDNVAKRTFIVSLGESFQFRADFILYRIGSFDDDNGILKVEQPAVVMNGISIAEDYAPVATAPIRSEKEKAS